MTVRQIFMAAAFLLPVLILALGMIWQPINWLFVIVAPLLMLV